MKANELRNLTTAEIEQKSPDLKRNSLTSVFNWPLASLITRLGSVTFAKK